MNADNAPSEVPKLNSVVEDSVVFCALLALLVPE